MYQVHRIDAYTDLSVVMVEGIGLHVEDILVSLVLSIIVSNQYSYVFKLLGQFCCLKHANRLKSGLRVWDLFF